MIPNIRPSKIVFQFLFCIPHKNPYNAKTPNTETKQIGKTATEIIPPYDKKLLTEKYIISSNTIAAPKRIGRSLFGLLPMIKFPMVPPFSTLTPTDSGEESIGVWLLGIWFPFFQKPLLGCGFLHICLR